MKYINLVMALLLGYLIGKHEADGEVNTIHNHYSER